MTPRSARTREDLQRLLDLRRGSRSRPVPSGKRYRRRAKHRDRSE